MIVDSAKVAAALRTFKLALLKGFNTTEPIVDPIAIVDPVPSTEVENIGATANLQMREWLGAREIRNVREFSHMVALKPYENTLGIEKIKFNTDKYKRYTRLIQEMGQQAKYLHPRLLAEILEGTSPALGYDGLALGAATHKIGTVSYNNTSTDVLSIDALKSARNWFGTLKNPSKEPMAITPTHLITSHTGTAYDIADELMTSESVVIDTVLTKNPMKGKYKHIAHPWISNQDWWALAALSGPDRPVLLYPYNKGVQFTHITSDQNKHVFDTGEYLFGGEYWTVGAVGAWYTIRTSDGSGS